MNTRALVRVALVALLVALLPAVPAAAIVEADPPPSFALSFGPDPVGPASTAVATFTIDNSGSGAVADDLAFHVDWPVEMSNQAPSAVTTDCGGTVVAADGGGAFTFSGGGVGAGETCTITGLVTAADSPGASATTDDLTSTAGNSGPASGDLNVSSDLPGFTKSFSPSTVVFGGRSTLTFSIDNSLNDGALATLEFNDTLPAGMVVANPANASTTCGSSSPPQVTADPGSTTIDFSAPGTSPNPALGANASCTVSVDVTASAVGSLDNVSDELWVADGLVDPVSAGLAAATLNVTGNAGLLELAKDFTDDPVPPGTEVTLEFTVRNKSRDASATEITFNDDLNNALIGLAPSGPLPTDVCGAGSVLTFAGGVLTLTDGTLASGAACTFEVPLLVPATAAEGTYTNTAGPVRGVVGGSPATGNTASSLLYVVEVPVLTKVFTNDPTPAGGQVTLEFAIYNPSATDTMTDLAFTDDLGTASPGLEANELVSGDEDAPKTDVCGTGSQVTVNDPPDIPIGMGTIVIPADPTRIEFSGGTLDPGASCTFTVLIDVLAGTSGGTFTNTTSTITGTRDADEVEGPAASDDITIIGGPTLTKQFIDDPVAPGDSVTVEYTLEHPDTEDPAAAIAFADDLTTLAPSVAGLTATSVVANTCTGAVVDITTDPTLIDVSGGSLAPGADCLIAVELDVPNSATAGAKSSTTSAMTSTVGGVAVQGGTATDVMTVSGFTITKQFLDTPVIAGGAVRLQYTLDNLTGQVDATNIQFDDDLDGVITGMEVTSPGANRCGGTFSGTSTLSFSGGSVTQGSACSFAVDVLVPATAEGGTYSSATTGQQAFVGGTPVALDPAIGDLEVGSALIEFGKSFLDDPVAPGGTVQLQFDLTNRSTTQTITDLAFSDDLDAVLSGLAWTSPEDNTCGGMAAAPGSIFDYSGGTLGAGGSCSITINVTVPAGAPATAGPYLNETSIPSGKVGGLDVTGNPATDLLYVRYLELSKSFDGPTVPGDTAELTFTITNNGAAINDLVFSDDLEAMLSGATAGTGSPNPPCGPSSSLTGTSILSFSGGALAAETSCEFSVIVQVPGGTAPGTYPNTTSDLTIGAPPPPVPGGDDPPSAAEPAAADLAVEPPPTFAKAFAPDTIEQGRTSTLTFTIDNIASAVEANNLDFSDPLPAGVTVAATPNASTTCAGGTLTAVAESSTITYTGGVVAANATCTVTVDVVAGSTGAHVNTTGDLTSSSGNSGTATDTLNVTAPPAPTFTKAYTDATIQVDDTTTLTFTVDNTASAVAATSLAFTDVFPAGTEVAATPNLSNGCAGTPTVIVGAGQISLTGGSVGPETTCALSVDVTATAQGDLVNTTGDLTSSAGNSGTASDTLTVTLPPGLTKDFSPSTIAPGATSTLTLTIDNTTGLHDATALQVLDPFPPGMTVADTPVLTNDCGGAATANPGDTQLALTGGTVIAGATCSVTVDVTSSTLGFSENVTGDLTSSSGHSGNASAVLLVDSPAAVAPPSQADLVVSLVPETQTVAPGQTATSTVTVTNDGPDATTATLTITGPGVAASDAAADCTAGAGELVCDLGVMAAAATTSLDVITTHPEPGTDTVAASVDGIATDPDPDNNDATATITVEEDDAGSPDLTQFSIDEAQARFPSSTFAQSGFAQAGPTAATWAVIGRDDVFADSLAGTVLTGTAPLLYTPPAILDERIVDELARLLGDSGTVYLLGGEAALSPDIDAALTDLGYDPVRLDGPTRVETALAVADEALRLAAAGDLPEWDGLVGVARADSPADNPTAAWADSVTAGAWTAAEGVPLLLTPTDSLHHRVAEWLLDNDVSRAVVLGGEAAIAADTMTALRAVVPDVQRVAGSERAGTAVAVAETLRGVGPDGTRGYVIVGGYADTGWAHGLLAGGRAADNGTAILLVGVDQVPPATLAAVTSCADEPVTVERLGETEQVSDAVMAQLDGADDQPC